MSTEPLDLLNRLPESSARSLLLECCGSQTWVARMLAARPFATVDGVLDAADRAWRTLDRADWLEAFRAHPRIGQRRVDRPGRSAAWAADEQSGAARATEDVREALADANAEYERRFGHIFIVCATGKSADEMLDLLRIRSSNDPGTELEIAAEEQRKITRLRLRKLIEVSKTSGHPEIPQPR